MKTRKQRIKKMEKEFNKKPKIALFPANGFRGMVIQSPIHFTAKCEHHGVGFEGAAHVGYVVAPKGKIIGLSKIARVVEYFLNPTILTTQEHATTKIIEALDDAIGAMGVVVILQAKHFCICHRGVKQRDSITTTSEIRGIFYHQHVKNEFLTLIGRNLI